MEKLEIAQVTDEAGLRECYPPTLERSRLKTLRKLDQHCRRFIELSPFLCLGTSSDQGADVTPRGGSPGFVRIPDDNTLLLPDSPGNNRLDTLTNLLSNPSVGLLFLIPGVDETLRVNGTASISTDPALLARCEVNGKTPRSALVITVREAFLHCAKALLRSKLWRPESQVPRDRLPSLARMLKDQIEIEDSAEEMEASISAAYRDKLY